MLLLLEETIVSGVVSTWDETRDFLLLAEEVLKTQIKHTIFLLDVWQASK